MSFVNIIGNFIGNVSGGLILPSCAEDVAISWHKNLNIIVSEGSSETIEGVFDSNETEDYIAFDSHPDVTGDKTITFKGYLSDDNSFIDLKFVDDSLSDYFYVDIYVDGIFIYVSDTLIYYATPENLIITNTILEFSITKTTGGVISATVNGSNITFTSVTTENNLEIGDYCKAYKDAYVWDININDEHAWVGNPNGNQDTAWEDTIGSINGSVVITSTIATADISESITGVLAFDGIDDSVTILNYPNISGDKKISFYLYLNKDTDFSSDGILQFPNTATDHIKVLLNNSNMLIYHNNQVSTDNIYCDISGLNDQILFVEITKTDTSFTDVSINGNSVTMYPNNTVANVYNTYAAIGAYGSDASYSVADDLYVWNISIYDDPSSSNTLIHNWLGYPSGNTDDAWVDTIGDSDGFVRGYNTTANISFADTLMYVKDSIGTDTRDVYYGQYLDPTSGQIDFKRTSGTFDYIDPSDGSLVEGVSIPSDGLYTVPTNGICEIITSDGSYYPCCERAGTVLHDVNEDSVHISVDSPVWSEGLYGSDYLNQYGFITKTDSDALDYDWETLVDSSTITLDDDCLVPLAQWEYVNVIDSEGEIITDSEGENIQVKENI